MSGYGLYLPRLFKDQKYRNNHNLPFLDLKARRTFVSQTSFEEIYAEDKMLFNYLTTEMVLRGGEFLLENDSFYYPENELKSNKVIYVSVKTPKMAYKQIDFGSLNIDYIFDGFNVKSNYFFHNIPLDGFRVLNLTDEEINRLEKDFLKAGFVIYNANPSMLSIPNKGVTTKRKINNEDTKSSRKKQEHQQKNNIGKEKSEKTLESAEEKRISGKESNQKSIQVENKKPDLKTGTQLINEDTVSLDVPKGDKKSNVASEAQEHLIRNKNRVLQYKVKSKKITTDYRNLENWMDFFLELGYFLVNVPSINLYISYVDEILPTLFLILGLLDGHYTKSQIFNVDLKKELNKKKNIIFYNSSEENWRIARNYRIEELYIAKEKQTYLIVTYNRSGQPPITKYIPEKKWLEDVRISSQDNKKRKSGRIKIDDTISDYFKNRYGEKQAQYYKFLNQTIVNLVGRGIHKKIGKYLPTIKFTNNKIQFTPQELIYLDSNKFNNNHFTNVGLINSTKHSLPEHKDIVSIFLNSNNSLRFEKYKTSKNIYIINRMKPRKNLNDELFVNQISKKNHNQKSLEQFFKLLNIKQINVPKGIELYEWR